MHEVLLDLYEDLIGYAQSLCMSSRKTAVIAPRIACEMQVSMVKQHLGSFE